MLFSSSQILNWTLVIRHDSLLGFPGDLGWLQRSSHLGFTTIWHIPQTLTMSSACLSSPGKYRMPSSVTASHAPFSMMSSAFVNLTKRALFSLSRLSHLTAHTYLSSCSSVSWFWFIFLGISSSFNGPLLSCHMSHCEVELIYLLSMTVHPVGHFSLPIVVMG